MAKKWTHFHDMHSGGSQKLDWGHFFIEAPKAEAEVIFQNRFGRNPNRVTCTCCGEDYAVRDHSTLEQASGFERGCLWEGEGYVEKPDTRSFRGNGYKTLEEYLKSGGGSKGQIPLVIRKDEIKPEEREGTLRPEGFIWQGEGE